ncbi:MAG: DUF502 domain-containing protein [Methanosarcinales archaeon]|nr:DUF502 domain-containing protein [Methanosarcinales archaeon]
MDLKKYLITGVATAVPLILTAYILIIVVQIVDGISQPVVAVALGREVPGLGVAVTLGLLILLGMFVSLAVGKKVADLTDRWMLRIPFSRSIYSVIKNMSETLFSGKKDLGKVVLIELVPRVYSIGFLTSKSPAEAEKTVGYDLSNVYIPTALNPTQGLLVMVPEDKVLPVDMSTEKGLELVLSAGLSRGKEQLP